MLIRDGRIFLTFLSNALIFFAIYQANDWLTPWQVNLKLDFLYLVFGCLYLRIRSSLIVALGSGAFVYAGLPSWTIAVVSFGAVYLLVIYFRDHFHRDNPLQVLILASVGNLLLFILIGLDATYGQWGSLLWWQRMLVDLAFSEITLWIVTLPLIHWQRHCFLYFGINVAAEMQSR